MLKSIRFKELIRLGLLRYRKYSEVGIGTAGIILTVLFVLLPNLGYANEKIRVIWQPGDEQPFYYANAENIWEKYGLELNLIEVQQGTAELAAIASNSADIALLGPGPFVSGVSRGIDMVAIYPTVDFASLEGLYVRPNSSITGLKSLIGKKVSVPFGSSADSGLRFGLKKEGVDASKVTFENGAPAELLAGFVRGNLNAVYIWSTWGQRLLAAGAHLVSTDASEGVNAGPTVIAVRRSYLKEHPKLVAKFLAAMDEGAVKSNANPSVAAKALKRLTKVTYQQGLTIARKERSLTLKDALDPAGEFSLIGGENNGLASLLVRVGAQLKKEGLISQVPSDMSQYVSASPARQAQNMRTTMGKTK